MRFKLAIAILSFSVTTSTGVFAASEQHVGSPTSFAASAAIFEQHRAPSVPSEFTATGGLMVDRDADLQMPQSALFGSASSEPLQSNEPSRWLMMVVALFLVCYQLRRKHRSLQLQHIAGF
jgi:hypothetical protein